ncbi:hypothetical protein ABKN59_001275 [Abortiporus biennis]
MTKAKLSDIQAQRCLGAVMGYTTREQWKNFYGHLDLLICRKSSLPMGLPHPMT